MSMIMVSSVDGPHAISLRTDGAPSPGAACPCQPIQSPGARRHLVCRRAWLQMARGPAPSSRSLPTGREHSNNGPHSSAGSEAAGPPRGIWGPGRRARPSAARAPGPAPTAPAGCPWRSRLGPHPERPALLRDRASKGAKTRPRAVALGYEPVGPPRRTRGDEPGA